jgi:hypothetical protein
LGVHIGVWFGNLKEGNVLDDLGRDGTIIERYGPVARSYAKYYKLLCFINFWENRDKLGRLVKTDSAIPSYR